MFPFGVNPDKLTVKACPYCGGVAYISTMMGKAYIKANHTKKCRIEPDTWLMSEEPITKQVKAWNRRR